MWPLIDRPIIEHVLDVLRRWGIGQMAISANGRTHTFERHLGYHPTPDVTVYYSEDAMPRGTAGCLKDCQEWLGNEPFIVVHGASLILDVDLHQLLQHHRSSGAVMTIAATAQSSESYPQSMLLKPAGLYVCEPQVLAHIRSRGYQDIKEQLIPRLTSLGLKVQAAPIAGRVISIRNEESYINAMVDVMNDPARRRGFVQHLPESFPGHWIDPTAQVHPTARLVGPVYVGPGAVIEHDAVVVGPAIIGSDCRIGEDAVVHESILWASASVGAAAHVEQAVLAQTAAVARGIEVRGSIVLDSTLSAAERQSLGGSRDLTATEINGIGGGFWRQLWRSVRPWATARI